MIILIISILLLLCILCIIVYAKCRDSPRIGSLDLPPVYPGALPLIGHAHKLLGDHEHMFCLMNSLSRESLEKGGVIVLSIGLDNYYIITDPDDLTTAGNKCLQKHFAYNFFEPWLGNGLISGTDLAVWKRHRKLLHPAFSQQVLNGFLEIFNSQARQFVNDLVAEVGRGPFDHVHYLQQIGLETVCKTVFSIDLDKNDLFDKKKYMATVGEMLDTIARRFQSPWIHNDALYSLTRTKKKQDQYVKYLNDTCDAVLQRKKTLHTEKNAEHKYKAFMDLILELAADGDMTDNEMWEEMNTIIVAGYETSANTLMYTLILLGSYAEVQRKVYTELQEVFGDSHRNIMKHDLSKLVYLEAVIKETMRLYTVTPVLLRQVDEDVQLKNYVMPSGSNCILLLHGLHRHSIWGPDAEQFKPERWLDPSTLLDPHSAINKAFAGFGVGKRFCMGKSYALMSMKTTLAHVLRQYRVTADVANTRLKLNGMLLPVSGHHISIKSRKCS